MNSSALLTFHSNDGEGTTDPRLIRIPSADWPEGSQRPIWPNPENYPRYVGTDRLAEEYFPLDGQVVSAPFGYIDQVNHTFAYFEETYGVMNEKQVGIGESTCSAVYGAVGPDVEGGGGALMSVDEMSKIAMERASSSREAVELMGEWKYEEEDELWRRSGQ